MVPHIPIEIVDEILLLLGTWAKKPNRAYRTAIFLQRSYVRTALESHLHLPSMDDASARGLTQVLDLSLCTRRPCAYTVTSIDQASANGYVAVLEWWRSSGLPLKYSSRDGIVFSHGVLPMDLASKGGHLASANGYVRVMDWWIESGLELKYENTSIMYHANSSSRTDVLQWWKTRSGVPVTLDRIFLSDASKTGCVEMLEWWKTRSGIKKFHAAPFIDVMGHASSYGHADVLQWWRTSGLRIEWGAETMDAASSYGHLEVLEWWKRSGLEMKWTEVAMNKASAKGLVQILDWWKASGLTLKWTRHAVDWASNGGHLDVLEWWRLSGLEIKWSGSMEKRIEEAFRNEDAVAQWWNALPSDLMPIPVISDQPKQQPKSSPWLFGWKIWET
ncbi:hypothetical protein BJ742DRAFT_883596 [Cladochytrium replicatum]|nr:hypothetical protein BJ742DRAFT_883596 [Cladochytrium replicatum]